MQLNQLFSLFAAKLAAAKLAPPVIVKQKIQIVDPHIKVDNNYKTYTGAKENGLFVKKPDGSDFNGWCWPGNSAYIDFTNPEARTW